MNDRFLHIESYAHATLVEEIMWLIGRGSKDPRSYRRTLESFSIETLRRTRDELIEEFCPAPAEALHHSAEANSRVPNGEVPETREDHQNRSELPARDILLLQPALP